MEWINNLEKLIKISFNVAKVTLPDDAILEKAGTSPVRFRMLIKNEVKMSAWEAVVFSDWLGTDPRDMVSTIYDKKMNLQPSN